MTTTTTTAVDVPSTAAAIASALGDGWTGAACGEEWHDGRADLRHTDGRHLIVYTVWNARGRLSISGITPHSPDLYLRKPCGQITVSATRPPAAIAAEITRRLLPVYAEALEEYRQARQSADTAATGQAHALAQLAAALGVPVPTVEPGRSGRSTPVRVPYSATGTYGEFTPDYQGSTVTIELRNVALADACALAQAVRAARGVTR